MANTAKRLYGPAQPGTSIATLATVGSGKKWIVTEIIVTNTTATAATLTLSIVPVGGSAGTTNRICAAMPVNANVTLVMHIRAVMDVGDFLAALQGTSGALTVTISGVEIA